MAKVLRQHSAPNSRECSFIFLEVGSESSETCLPIDVTTVFTAGCVLGVQFNASKYSITTADGSYKADGARQISRDLDGVADGEIPSSRKAAGGRGWRRHVVVSFAG